MDKFVRAYNEDGRDFIRTSVRRMKNWHDTEKEVVIPSKTSHRHKQGKYGSASAAQVFSVPQVISHFVMNLPATAIEFLGTALKGTH